MTQSSFLPAAILAALVVAQAGCADHPAAPARAFPGASAAVVAAAAGMGFSPVLVKGKTLFCQREELTGSIIARERCIGVQAVRDDVAARRAIVHQITQPLGAARRPR